MDLIRIIGLAIGLSMDSLVIALASGAIICNHKAINILKIAGMLGFVQMALTVFGWVAGSSFAQYIYSFDHWVAFGILTTLGGKVLYEAIKNEDTGKAFNPLNIRIMFGLAIAASIDAAAVGLSSSLIGSPILQLSIIVGVVTFIISAFGVYFGCKVGQRYNTKINIIGGAILIAIGCSVLYQHLSQ